MKDGERATVQVSVAFYMQLPNGVIFKALDESRAKKLVEARMTGLEALDFTKDKTIPDIMGRFRVVDRQRGGGFKKGELLEITFERGHFSGSYFRKYFSVLEDSEDPYARKVVVVVEKPAPAREGKQPGEPEGKPPEHDVEKVSEVRAAIALLDPEDKNDYTDNGKPTVEAIVKVLGYDVTAAERDAALEPEVGE